jgi:hypothetical protein
MTDTHYDRTHYQALLEAKFHARYNDLNESLYRQLDRILTATSLLAGAGAFVNLLTKVPGLTEIAGLIFSVAAIVQALSTPGVRAVEHRELARRFQQLVSQAPSLDLSALDRELNELRAGAPNGFESLNPIAQNDVLRSEGHAKLVRVSAWNEFLAFFA